MENEKGLFGKYLIQKADGTPIDPQADYFVLRLDKDPAALEAILAYAHACENKLLAEDLFKKYEALNKPLDKEDIESLGYSQNKKVAKEFYLDKVDVGHYTDHYIILHENGKIQIDIHYETVYFGKIRNKYHLQQILNDVK